VIRFGLASITVTATDAPSFENTRVMPAFVPTNPIVMVASNALAKFLQALH
jgi:hypothetical protein